MDCSCTLLQGALGVPSMPVDMHLLLSVPMAVKQVEVLQGM